MAITRLKRKVRKNRSKAKKRKMALKRLLATPVIKNIEINPLEQGASYQKRVSTVAVS